MTKTAIDNARAESWIRREISGDTSAHREFVEYLWPILVETVRASRGIRALANAEDGVHDVVARLVEKLGQPEGRGIGLYLPWQARNPDKSFEDWLRIVTKNAIRDYLRDRLGSVRDGSREPSVKRLLNEFASSPLVDDAGVRPPMTLAQTARELMEYARERLTEPQFSVLDSWLQGASFAEIGSEQQLSEDEARQRLRAAVAVLRRNFAAEHPK